MVLKAQVRTCELRGHKKKKKKKISPTLSTLKSQVRTCGVNFGKIKNFDFMVLKAHVGTCDLRCHEKKDFPNPFDMEVTGPDLWRQFKKNESFCFYGPKGTGPDL